MKYSTFDRNSRNPLDLFMSTLSLPVGVAASGLDRVLTVLKTGSEASGALAVAIPFGAGAGMFEGIQNLRKMRKQELAGLKAKVLENRRYYDGVLETLNEPGTEEVPLKKFNKAEFDKLKTEIMEHNPSSSLLKAMEKVEGLINTTYESGLRSATEENPRNLEKSYQIATGELIKAITSEIERMTKLVKPSEVNQSAGIFAKLAVELKNWFYEIKLSFEKSKLQGLKHLALGFGEVLLGIGAFVATTALAVLMFPVLVASIGVNLATRAASAVACGCLHVFSRVYSLTASIFSQFLSRKKDDAGQSPQSKFDQKTEEMILKLEARADKFFAQAKKLDLPESLLDVKKGFEKVKKGFGKAKGLFTGARNQSAQKAEPDVAHLPEPGSGIGISGGGQGAEGIEKALNQVLDRLDPASVVAAGVVPIAKGGGD